MRPRYCKRDIDVQTQCPHTFHLSWFAVLSAILTRRRRRCPYILLGQYFREGAHKAALRLNTHRLGSLKFTHAARQRRNFAVHALMLHFMRSDRVSTQARLSLSVAFTVRKHLRHLRRSTSFRHTSRTRRPPCARTRPYRRCTRTASGCQYNAPTCHRYERAVQPCKVRRRRGHSQSHKRADTECG